MPLSTAVPPFQLSFSPPGSGGRDGIPARVLAGPATELILPDVDAKAADADLTWYRSGSGDGALLAGLATARAGEDLEAAAHRLYTLICSRTSELHLYRMWNYVPRINALEHGLENYQRFCRGRSLAFEEALGPGFARRLPAASAVGLPAGRLTVAFLAGAVAPAAVESPVQIPAFEYPAQYGPRPPSFSRATVVESPRRRAVYVSGTAAIRGHATVAAHDIEGQLACTIENLASIAQAAGAALQTRGWSRRFKVYLRHASDLARVRGRLEAEGFDRDAALQYLEADLCRSDLDVEIEAVLTREAG